MNAYEEKRAARIERMRSRALKLRSVSAVSHERARVLGDRIPLGQPILVGHHSERRHRRDLARIDAGYRRSFEAANEATDLERRAASAETHPAISSDDPDAVSKLRIKLGELERQRTVLLEVNAQLRKGATPAEVAPLLTWWDAPAQRIEIWRSLGHRTIPLGNASANIRAVKDRIVDLERRAAAPPVAPIEHDGVRIVEEDNRVRIYFPDKPAPAVRAKLKSSGFRWSPSVGAWQAYVSHNAWYRAKQIAGVS